MNETGEMSIQDYMHEALYNDKLVFIAITSAAQGYVHSEGFPFGQGKSNLAMGLSEGFFSDIYPDASPHEVNELVKQNMGYDDRDVMNMVIRGRQRRIPCWISDDMEVCFGKHRSYDNKFRELAYFMQTIRPYVAIFIGTMPDLGQLALAWRELFMFEIKVPFRGYCECQRINRWTKFNDPQNPRSRLHYKGEQEFPMANSELRKWYVEWRDKRVMEYHKRLMDQYFKEPEKPEPPPQLSETSQAASTLSRRRWAKPEAII